MVKLRIAKPFLWLAVALTALIASYALYLGVRIVDQRTKAPKRVHEIIASMDPAVAAIPDTRLTMLLRVEDPTFWTNDGIDMKSKGAGMTTLSQGLGKRLFFRRFSPGFAKLGKVELMVLTRFALVPKVAKRDILHAALATAYLGNEGSKPVIGFADGARRYYGKELGALSDHEFLGLVATLLAPKNLNPKDHPLENAERVSRIERLLSNACSPLDVNDVSLEGCAISN